MTRIKNILFGLSVLCLGFVVWGSSARATDFTTPLVGNILNYDLTTSHVLPNDAALGAYAFTGNAGDEFTHPYYVVNTTSGVLAIVNAPQYKGTRAGTPALIPDYSQATTTFTMEIKIKIIQGEMQMLMGDASSARGNINLVFDVNGLTCYSPTSGPKTKIYSSPGFQTIRVMASNNKIWVWVAGETAFCTNEPFVYGASAPCDFYTNAVNTNAQIAHWAFNSGAAKPIAADLPVELSNFSTE